MSSAENERLMEQAIREYLKAAPVDEAYIQFRIHKENEIGYHTGLIERVTSVGGKEVLDAGCGDGGLSIALARKGAKVTAFDLSPLNCQVTLLRSRRYDQMDVRVLRACAECIPLRKKFDVILFMGILEHVQDADQTLEAIKALLKDDALLFATVPSNLYRLREVHSLLLFLHWIPRRYRRRYIALYKRVRQWLHLERETQQGVSPDFVYFERIFSNRRIEKLLLRHGFTTQNMSKEILRDKIMHPEKVASAGKRRVFTALNRLHLGRVLLFLVPVLLFLEQVLIAKDIEILARLKSEGASGLRPGPVPR